MRDILAILRRNFVTPLVIAIYSLAVILLSLREFRDAWFISVVITLNTIIAIIQEIRAQRALKKLELMSAPKARLIKGDDSVVEITFDQLVIGNRIELKLGDEIPADGTLLKSSGLEVDESILTGESIPVEKQKNDTVYAASSVVAGGAIMEVKAVNGATKIGAMASVLKRYNPQLTPLQASIRRTILWFTYGAIGLAVLIVVVYSFSGEGVIQILKTITSSAVAVVPEGLILASSLLLAFGSLKLAYAKVLPQKLSAIEAMALLDILCVDKTGTLTSDKITFERIELFDKNTTNASELVGIIAKETSSGSSTGVAITDSLGTPNSYEVIQNMAFSSVRKMSGLKFVLNNVTYSMLMGAPEFLELLAPLKKENKDKISLLASEGKRVLLLASFDDTKSNLKDLKPKSGKAVGLIVLSNELRDGVKDTVSYLQNNGVNIRVISGDNLDTVKYVAKNAGIKNSSKALTGADLANISPEKWDNTVSDTVVFARVLPEQKERLLETFKRLGNFTGMVGDGINDALALKKSDLGVAMYSGATATRRIADIVLLNNSFNSLPVGMKLGNQIMQAIEILANLFFHKVIFWVMLLFVTLAIGLVYPFDPRHITFMNLFAVTIPTVMWTLFPPHPRHKMSAKYFWRNTILAVSPIALLSGFAVTLSYIILAYSNPGNMKGVFTTTVLVSSLFIIYMTFLSPLMFEVKISKGNRLVYVIYMLIVILVSVFSLVSPIARDFFNFTSPILRNWWILSAIIFVTMSLQYVIARRAGRKFRRRIG